MKLSYIVFKKDLDIVPGPDEEFILNGYWIEVYRKGVLSCMYNKSYVHEVGVHPSNSINNVNDSNRNTSENEVSKSITEDLPNNNMENKTLYQIELPRDRQHSESTNSYNILNAMSNSKKLINLID